MKEPSIPVGAKICDECRKRVGKLIPETAPSTSSDSDEEEGEIPEGIGDAYFKSPQAMKSQEYAEALQGINDCLGKVGQTPIVAHKLGQVKYPKQKLKKMTKSFKKVMLKDPSSSSDEEGTMLRQLKEKFHTSSSRSEKIQVLTVLRIFVEFKTNLEHQITWFVEQKSWLDRKGSYQHQICAMGILCLQRLVN